ncbi:hypothetical protein HPB49_008054 [Dermacentor silvarum]|uniref:Uncharacterized protein n=1 Tax=Dermacentor silvarum TaxID=543639 RepID=A0ACB8DIF7_DERSI|nr:hypothetical protein HPB49_008054 [Dermacentor silvarum]
MEQARPHVHLPDPDVFAPTKQEEACRRKVVGQLQQYLRRKFKGAKLTLFGSSCNGFGLARSDLDICLTFENSEDAKADDLPRQLKGLLWRNRDLTAVSFVSRARVPVIKFLHQPTGLEGDLSIGNILALRNTMLLKTYSEIDRRVRVLGYAFKFLAKRFGIGDASHSGMCSYAFILMTIFYLQQCKPAVLPVLQELHPSRMQKPEEMVEGCNVWFFHDMKRLDSVWSGRGRNTMDAGELWLGMMKFYEDFNFQEQVVSVRQSAPLLKTEKGWDALVAIEEYRATMGAFVRGRFLFEEPMVDFLPADATSHFFLAGEYAMELTVMYSVIHSGSSSQPVSPPLPDSENVDPNGLELKHQQQQGASNKSSRLSICYYHQDLHQRRLQAGSRPTLRPSYSSRLSTPTFRASLPATVGDRPDARAPSIFGASCFGRLDDRFARHNCFGPPPEFPLASSCPGIILSRRFTRDRFAEVTKNSVWGGRGRNTMDTGELWLGMMFCEDFNFQQQVVSVRQSAPLLKTQKGSDALVAIEAAECHWATARGIRSPQSKRTFTLSNRTTRKAPNTELLGTAEFSQQQTHHEAKDTVSPGVTDTRNFETYSERVGAHAWSPTACMSWTGASPPFEATVNKELTTKPYAATTS